MDISNQLTRKRSANFTNSEKLLLIETVSKYKLIVENKKTDNITTAEKTAAWQKNTEEFNSSGALCPRDTECLRRAYDNRKKLLRKTVAIQKRELYKTGGGVPTNTTKKEPGDELLLAMVNEKTVHGLSSCFGGDSPHTSVSFPTALAAKLYHPEPTTSADENIEIIFDDGEDNNFGADLTFGEYSQEYDKNMEEAGDTNPSANLSTVNGDDMENSGTQKTTKGSDVRTWKRYKIGDLKAQPSHSLVPQSQKTPIGTPNLVSKDFARRRPRTVVKALTTSELSEKYNLLLDERLEVAKYQKELLKNRIQYEKVEHELRVKALKSKTEEQETL